MVNLLDPGAKLDTGMKASEALSKAEKWWMGTGRRLMKNHDAKAEAEKVSLDPDSDNFLPSGIVNGLPWDELTKREKLTITKHWHHAYVRKPQTIGE